MLMTRMMLGTWRSALMASAEGDGAGAGGGGGGGGAAGALSDAAKKEITDMIGGANKTLFDRVVAKIPTVDALKEGLGIGAIMTALEALKTAPPPTDKDKGGKDKNAEPDPAVARLTAEVEKLTKERETERAARVETEARTKKNEERIALTDMLRKGGVPDHHVNVLVPYLHGEKALISRDDKGAIVWAGKDQYGEVAATPLEAGVTEWLKTDEGKNYLPPQETGGSGNRGGGKPNLSKDPKTFTTTDLGNLLMASRSGGG